jgi:hypothetical protein
MEAGIIPVHPSVVTNMGIKILALSTNFTTVCQIAAQTKCNRERHIISTILQTITYHSTAILHPLKYSNNTQETFQPTTDTTHRLIYKNFTALWRELKFPHDQGIRKYILKFIIHLHQYLAATKSTTDTTPSQITVSEYTNPKKVAYPSYTDQITSPTSSTIDPYIVSLSKNYYYPLSKTIMNDEMDDETMSQQANPPSEQPKSPSNLRKMSVTVEDSIETITDIINELEEDEPPAQTQSTQSEENAVQQALQLKPSSYTHRFSIYRRNGLPSSNLKPQSQLNLFKSFCKCLKAVDSQLHILPIRNDHNMHPINTTDQITHIDEIGIPNYFKAYKRTIRTLSGDFHIGTKLTFDELKENKTLSTWFHMNGYNITISGCQSSDMVKIGFLSRVRGFTYRDDMQTHIAASTQWKQNPFHFRLYFDMFSTNAKGKNTYVLMIDVDRPNIDRAISFFQNFFDGDKLNSPNRIPYLFFPLYRKTYTEDERLSIICDNDHHTDSVSVVAIQGLNDLNTVVQMTQGIYITIRHLLLAIPCQGTMNDKLFLQVERQANNDWQLCCFHSMDATKITLRLGNIESLIKRYIRPEDHAKLFTDESRPLKFSGQAAPIKKGRPRLPILEVPEETLQYTSKAFKKLYTPIPKRPIPQTTFEAINIPGTPTPTPLQPQTISPNQKQSSNSENTQTVTSHDISEKMCNVEVDIKNQNTRLARLEDICSQLASSSQNLSTQLITLTHNVNEKLGEMAASINLLNQSPSTRSNKYQKSSHGLTEDLSFQS